MPMIARPILLCGNIEIILMSYSPRLRRWERKPVRSCLLSAGTGKGLELLKDSLLE
jgi:hypothetical protein